MSPRRKSTKAASTVAALEIRVAMLERAAAAAAAAAGASADASAGEGVPPGPRPTKTGRRRVDEYDVMRLVEARPSAVAAGAFAGALVSAGVARFGERRYADMRFASVPEIMERDASRLALVLARVASGPRIVLLRRLLRGQATRTDLLEEMSWASAGQLYHHLNELQAAGIIGQPERGVFAIKPDRAIPILSLLGIAATLAADIGEPAAPAATTKRKAGR